MNENRQENFSTFNGASADERSARKKKFSWKCQFSFIVPPRKLYFCLLSFWHDSIKRKNKDIKRIEINRLRIPLAHLSRVPISTSPGNAFKLSKIKRESNESFIAGEKRILRFFYDAKGYGALIVNTFRVVYGKKITVISSDCFEL